MRNRRAGGRNSRLEALHISSLKSVVSYVIKRSILCASLRSDGSYQRGRPSFVMLAGLKTGH